MARVEIDPGRFPAEPAGAPATHRPDSMIPEPLRDVAEDAPEKTPECARPAFRLRTRRVAVHEVQPP